MAVVIYPVLKRRSERLALGYVIARTLEAAFYVIDAVLLLTLLTVSRRFADAGAADSTVYRTLGDLVLAARDWAGNGLLDATAFGLSAVILNAALYRARLVPRWLAVGGLVGAASYMAAGVMVIYGLEPLSTAQVVLEAPLGVQEMVLAIWLIVRGFSSAEATALSTG